MKTIILSTSVMVLLSTLTGTVEVNPLSAITVIEDYVEVPAGKVLADNRLTDVTSFYISRYEITNRQYQAFVDDLLAEGKLSEAEVARIKVDYWKKASTVAVDSNVKEWYHTYKGFADFPVVNISYEAAMLYCQWLTEKIRAENKTKYDVEVRLPTRAQWIRAARGTRTYATYAWGSPYIRDGKGYFLCNFKRLGSEQIHFNEETQAYEIVKYTGDQLPNLLTDKVDAYPANDFGLYNTCGNVAEMISEPGIAVGGSWNDPGYDVRVESIADYTEASPFVGFRPVLVLKEK